MPSTGVEKGKERMPVCSQPWHKKKERKKEGKAVSHRKYQCCSSKLDTEWIKKIQVDDFKLWIYFRERECISYELTLKTDNLSTLDINKRLNIHVCKLLIFKSMLWTA